MTEPDELYTLRAQYWLGHYAMAIDEAKQVVRRPMPPALKLEREDCPSAEFGLVETDDLATDQKGVTDHKKVAQLRQTSC